MAWDFETDAEYVPPDDRRRQVINSLKEEVRKYAGYLEHEVGNQ